MSERGAIEVEHEGGGSLIVCTHGTDVGSIVDQIDRMAMGMCSKGVLVEREGGSSLIACTHGLRSGV